MNQIPLPHWCINCSHLHMTFCNPFIFFFFLIGKQKTIIKEIRKSTSCSWWWTTGKKNKKHNKISNQETKLREDINSEREEQSVKPNNETTPKDFVGINPLTHPTSSHYLQRNGDFVPTTHSTLSTLEPNSKYPNYDSQELINT